MWRRLRLRRRRPAVARHHRPRYRGVEEPAPSRRRRRRCRDGRWSRNAVATAAPLSRRGVPGVGPHTPPTRRIRRRDDVPAARPGTADHLPYGRRGDAGRGRPAHPRLAGGADGGGGPGRVGPRTAALSLAVLHRHGRVGRRRSRAQTVRGPQTV